jgi:hypothetical protein
MRYYEAIKDNLLVNDTVADEYFTELNQFDDDYMAKAKQYLCVLEDELAKGDSELRCVTGTRNITLNSFERWWTGKHLPPPTFKVNKPANTIAVKEQRKEAKDNTLVTLGVLLGALAALVPKQFIATPKEPTKIGQKKQEPKPFDDKNYTDVAKVVAAKFNLENVEVSNAAAFLNALFSELGLKHDPFPQTVDTNSGRFASAKKAAMEFLNNPRNQQS